MLDSINEYVQVIRKNYRFIYKENRGRDISAFLVACRDIILEYEYVCFLHDKKEKCEENFIDNKLWIKCLWENTIGSQVYIKNVVHAFLNDSKLGVLVPPPPLSEHYSTAYINAWDNNFENMRSLTEKLDLKCDLDEKKQPLTYGTVFWARVSAVKKLFEKKWNYTDFPQEPLPNDGTISHMIERSFGYVAQDAGFVTGWVMTDKYAAERVEYMNYVMEEMYLLLDEWLHLDTVASIKSFDVEMEKLKKFADANSIIYIYGAGKVAKAYRVRLSFLGRYPDMYIVSSKKNNPKTIEGVPVVSIDEVDFSNNPGIIIGVGKEFKLEVLLQLKSVVGQTFVNILEF